MRDLIKAAKAMSDETRLRILNLLIEPKRWAYPISRYHVTSVLYMVLAFQSYRKLYISKNITVRLLNTLACG